MSACPTSIRIGHRAIHTSHIGVENQNLADFGDFGDLQLFDLLSMTSDRRTSKRSRRNRSLHARIFVPPVPFAPQPLYRSPLPEYTTRGRSCIFQTGDDFYNPGDGGTPGKHSSILIILVAVGDVGDHLRRGVAGLCGRIWLAAAGNRTAAATKNRCVGGLCRMLSPALWSFAGHRRKNQEGGQSKQ